MPHYVRLVKATAQGARELPSLERTFGEAKAIMEKEGVRLVSGFATLGRYDFVAIVEAPDDRTMAKVSALIASKGNFSAETLPAIPIGEFIPAVTRA